MKSMLFIPIVVIFSFLSQLILTWWVIAVVAFVVSYFFHPGKFAAFAGCLLGVFILWSAKAYLADKNFDIAISQILSELIGKVSQGAIFFLTGAIGGIVAGLGGLLGDWTRQLSQK